MIILIKGMEMPKNCGTCFLRVGGCKQRMYIEHRPKGCPLIELPPHGDLVDRNKLLRKAKRESTYAWKMNLHARTETILNQFIDWLDGAEVIIEAEGETDGR